MQHFMVLRATSCCGDQLLVILLLVISLLLVKVSLLVSLVLSRELLCQSFSGVGPPDEVRLWRKVVDGCKGTGKGCDCDGEVRESSLRRDVLVQVGSPYAEDVILLSGLASACV